MSGRRWLQVALGYGLAVVCLVWVFHDVDLREVLRSASHVRWAWMLPAVLLDIASYVCQGERWRLLLPSSRSLGVARTTQAIYAGLFVSEVLPARLGELVRGYLVQRWSAVPLPALVGSILVERLFDGIWLAIGIVAVALTVTLPRPLMEAEGILGGVVLVALGLLVFLLLRARRGATVGKVGLLGRLLHALGGVGSSPRALGSFAVSFFIPFFEGLALWMVMVGYGLPLNVWSGIAVLLIVRLGTAIPNAPGNVGTYQALTVLALRLFGVGKATAAGFSVVAFVVLTVPLWGLGLLALSRSGITLGSLRTQLYSRATGTSFQRSSENGVRR
jgi:uncharacterized membrane protein YbhN (UPF0104 family)